MLLEEKNTLLRWLAFFYEGDRLRVFFLYQVSRNAVKSDENVLETHPCGGLFGLFFFHSEMGFVLVSRRGRSVENILETPCSNLFRDGVCFFLPPRVRAPFFLGVPFFLRMVTRLLTSHVSCRGDIASFPRKPTAGLRCWPPRAKWFVSGTCARRPPLPAAGIGLPLKERLQCTPFSA